MDKKREPLLRTGRPVNSPRAKARAAVLMASKPKPVRINFDLDFDTHRRLRILAAHAGLPVASLLRKAIEDLLDAREST